MLKILLLLLLLPFFNEAFAQQTILVNETTPCFLNYTAGIEMWSNCGMGEDWLSAALLPFEWITGGYFTMILVSIIILAVYLKYHKVIYTFGIGIVMLPISFQFFPSEFMGFAMIAIALGLTSAIVWMIREQLR